MEQDRNRARLLENMTVEEVRDALTATRTVILPIGCTEQHGYHLPISTDCYNASEIARRVSQATGCVVAPTLPYSFSGGELPGTVNVAPQVVSLFVMEICQSLLLQGFRNVIILLGHGGSENTQAIKDAADMLYRRHPDQQDWALAIAPFWQMSEICQKAFREKDFHSGWLETGLMKFWKPELVRERVVTDKPPVMRMLRKDQNAYLSQTKPVDDPCVQPRKRQNPKIQVGVLGDPFKADARVGKKVVEQVVSGVVRLVRKMERRGGLHESKTA